MYQLIPCSASHSLQLYQDTSTMVLKLVMFQVLLVGMDVVGLVVRSEMDTVVDSPTFSSFRNQNSMESANDGLNLGKRFPDLEPEKYK